MTPKLRITAVSYANTYPFVYGIEQSGILKNYELCLRPPAACALSFVRGECDVALVPVGALSQLSDYTIVTDLCIGAVNDVKSVLLVSNKSISEIKSIGLDDESETSVRLAKVLAKHFWHISPIWQKIQVKDFARHNDLDAFVVIGDKAFEISNRFAYKIDLASEWKQHTKLPFVFAVWVCRNHVSNDLILDFSQALHFGTNNLNAVSDFYAQNSANILDLKAYLTNNIDYNLDDTKHISLKKFLNYIKED
ncbi:MAG: menaquinone biosynthesis protein [Bacteroidota bacterium]